MLPRCAATGSHRNKKHHLIHHLTVHCCQLVPVVFVIFVLVVGQETRAGPPRYSSRIVEIQTGAIRGIILELNSRHLEPVEVFRGVPYAAPPVGPLRFHPPQSPLPWPGTRLADSFGSVCPQKYPDISNKTAALQFMPKGRYQFLKKLVPLLANQSEDCLFLNIYVPGSGNRGLEAPYAVLVFIHGESFEWGAGHPYDGSVLASYGHVIVVTLNFRLGVLDIYEDALEEEKQAVQNSESESEVRAPGKRKLKPSQKYSSPPSFSSESAISEHSVESEPIEHTELKNQSPIIDVDMLNRSPQEKDPIIGNKTIEVVDIHQESLNDSTIVEVIEVEVSSTEIYKKLVDIDRTLKFILARLNNLEAPKASNSPIDDFSKLPALPVETISALLESEDLLKNPEIARQLYNKFLQIAGRNSGEFIRRSLTTVFTNKLATTCSWTGQKNNYRIKGCVVIKILKGFLRTKSSADPNAADSGNLGVKDVTAALRWVKINIAAFGGDPTRVTLAGHGTGAAIVNLLFLSPNSKGLFGRVILLSGTALSPWSTIHNADSLRLSVGKQMGCLAQDSKGDDSEDIAPCMRSRPLQAILEVHLDSVRFMPRIAPSLPIDSDSTDPTYAMEHASDNFITCEVMLGITTTESYADFNANDIQYGFEEDQRNRVLRTYIRNTYVYHLNEIFSAVRNEYTDWDKPIPHPINIRDSTMEALSDGHTVAPLVRVAYLHARRGAKTYFFHFGYQTKDSDYPQRLGSVRGEDLSYILGQPLVGGLPFFPQNYSRQDMGVSEALLNFVTNFVKSGDPNIPGIPKEVPDYGTPREKTRYRGLTWDPYEIGTQFYLSITQKPKMKSHYRGHKMAVWLNLIPQLHQPGDEDVNMRHHHFYEREPHYYAGAVRAESFTRLPPIMHPASMTDSQMIGGVGSVNTECVPQTTADDRMIVADDSDSDGEEESEELLERLATRHYYSYTAALGVTVGVGCLLLVLNMLIFAGIYYQRDRDRRRENRNNHGPNTRHARSNSTPSTEETIPMSQRPSTPGSSARQSPLLCRREQGLSEMPPCYNTVPRSQASHDYHPPGPGSATNTLKKQKPPPPARTSSSATTTTGTVKKRVQIQEISV